MEKYIKSDFYAFFDNIDVFIDTIYFIYDTTKRHIIVNLSQNSILYILYKYTTSLIPIVLDHLDHLIF